MPMVTVEGTLMLPLLHIEFYMQALPFTYNTYVVQK